MNYEMRETILSKTVKGKHLGITMNANMKDSEHCRIAESNSNQVLRPRLEYRIQEWRLYRWKVIDVLENIQRGPTKLIPGLRDIRCEELV